MHVRLFANLLVMASIAKHPLTIFWFKRDLRLADNEALRVAIESPEPLLLMYIHEPSIWADSHYDSRHINFVKESLRDINRSLSAVDTGILCVQAEVLSFFTVLSQRFEIKTVYSTQETGIQITYQRDIAFAKFCKDEGIFWKEFQNNGVIRGLHDRSTWRNAWYAYMNAPLVKTDLNRANFLELTTLQNIEKQFEPFILETPEHVFQKGGRSEGLIWQDSFFNERLAKYSEYISKPELSRYGCSRISPYFAWGNLSIREVYQRAYALKKTSLHKRQLNAFLSRLRWQSHFIQKFEMEPRMEFEAVNRAFLSLEQPVNDIYVSAWKKGQTGYPLVDASMRCVAETGYINFRMRSMVTSFLTHHLFQHFTMGGPWLAQQFLDFEPGIHYGQMQMQAGFTGTNTVRVYNPVKNALEHDSQAVFIKNYVPELSDLPIPLAIEPWKVTAMESEMYGFNYGTDYPERIVDISVTRKIAVDRLYGQRKSDMAKSEIERILEKHTIRRKQT